jgi:hypothetical protein
MLESTVPGAGLHGLHAHASLEEAAIPRQDFRVRTLLPLTMLAMACFLQIGGYSVASVGFVAFVFTIFVLGTRSMLQGAAMALACAPLMLINLFPFLGESETAGAFVRTGRELSVLAVILAASVFDEPCSFDDKRRTDSFIVGCLAVLMLYTGLQFFSLKVLQQPDFFINWRLYGGISGVESEGGYRLTTLPSYWMEFGAVHGLELGESLRIRATAFYSEPSYLGLIVFALIFALTSRSEWRPALLVPIAMALVTTAMSETASGSMSVLIYLAARYRHELLRYLPVLLVTIGPAAVYMLADAIGRIASISSGAQEVSGYIRLVKPFENIGDVFSNGFLFGIPPVFLDRYVSPTPFGAEFGLGTDTAILNLVIFFGVGGVAILFMLWRAFAPLEFLFILLVGVFNGSLFGYDKAFVIGMAIAYSRLRVPSVEPTGRWARRD